MKPELNHNATGVKRPFKLEEIWRIRTRIEIQNNLMQLALLNLAIDSKLRSCDLLSLKVRAVATLDQVFERVQLTQKKTGQKARDRRALPRHPDGRSNPSCRRKRLQFQLEALLNPVIFGSRRNQGDQHGSHQHREAHEVVTSKVRVAHFENRKRRRISRRFFHGISSPGSTGDTQESTTGLPS